MRARAPNDFESDKPQGLNGKYGDKMNSMFDNKG